MAVTRDLARPEVRPGWPPAGRALPLLVLLVLGGVGGLYFLARQPVLPAFDATIYVTGAQSLARGQGYRLLGYPTEPPNTFYPPGYSLFLAPLVALWPEFPANLALLEFASLLSFYALLGLGALVLRRCYGAARTDVALAVLLAATTPLALWLSTAVMSDTLFGVLALGSVLLVSAGWERPGPRGLLLLLAGALLASLAFYTRLAGITLVAAVALDALRRARRESLARLAVGLLPGVLILPWFAWTALYGTSGYLRHWPQADRGWSLMILQFLLGDEVLWAAAPALVHDRVLPGVSALIVLAMLASTALFVFILYRSWRGWRREGGPVHLYVLLYLVFLLIWPTQVQGRFLWPLAPLLTWYLIEALRAAWARLRARLGAPRLPLPTLVVAALLVANGVWLARAAADVAHGAWVTNPEERAAYEAMQQTAAYLRGRDPPDALLGTNHLATTSWWYLYTGRHGLDALARADGLDPEFISLAKQGNADEVTYFIWERGNGIGYGGEADLPVLQAALAARGARPDPLYCVADRSICVYDWRPLAAPR